MGFEEYRYFPDLMLNPGMVFNLIASGLLPNFGWSSFSERVDRQAGSLPVLIAAGNAPMPLSSVNADWPETGDCDTFLLCLCCRSGGLSSAAACCGTCVWQQSHVFYNM